MAHPSTPRPRRGLRQSHCTCGNITPRGHGLIPGRKRAFTCEEILEQRARIEAIPPTWRARVAAWFRRAS